MAGKKTVQVKALINLKYDKNCFNIGNKLKVRADDITEMTERGYIELLEEVPDINENEGESVEEGG